MKSNSAEQDTAAELQLDGRSGNHLGAGVQTERSAGDGLQRAIDNASGDWWFQGAMLAVKQLAVGGRGFTVDHVLDVTGRPTDSRYVGVVFAVAQRQRIIEAVGCRVGRDGRLVRVWWGT